jgi:hypothetical protein
VHSLFKIVPELRKKYRDKKVVLHYHGSEARKQSKDSIQRQAEEMCNAVIGSTKDLEQFTGQSMIYIPNPVDTEHFRPPESHRSRDATAFTFKTTGSDISWVLQHLKENEIDISVEVLDRQANPVSYSAMPSIITRYGIYIDLKYIDNMLLQALSKTGLECLACGLRVLNHKLEYVDIFPPEHQPERVAEKMLEIYNRL